MEQKLWTVDDAMAWFQCSRGTVYKWIREDGLPAVKPGGGDLRFIPAELQAWAESQRKVAR
jgi:excisionase family DNA binding protein